MKVAKLIVFFTALIYLVFDPVIYLQLMFYFYQGNPAVWIFQSGAYFLSFIYAARYVERLLKIERSDLKRYLKSLNFRITQVGYFYAVIYFFRLFIFGFHLLYRPDQIFDEPPALGIFANIYFSLFLIGLGVLLEFRKQHMSKT